VLGLTAACLTLFLMAPATTGVAPLADAPTTKQKSRTDAGVVIYEAGRVELDWYIINDTVMGGRSQSRWVNRASEGGVFDGTLSLENYGGFTSVRSSQVDSLKAPHDTFVLRVRGDGRTYRFTVRSEQVRRGINYQRDFKTEAGKWLEVRLSIPEFQARWRGQAVRGAPVLRAEHVRSVGFLLADKTPGPFRLEVGSIHSVATGP